LPVSFEAGRDKELTIKSMIYRLNFTSSIIRRYKKEKRQAKIQRCGDLAMLFLLSLIAGYILAWLLPQFIKVIFLNY